MERLSQSDTYTIMRADVKTILGGDFQPHQIHSLEKKKKELKREIQWNSST
jgi:hypothetical protein